MKLKNKLIPLFTALGTVGVVTPLSITSCGTSTKYEYYDLNVEEYEPGITPTISNSYNRQKATAAYIDGLSDGVFTKDFLYGYRGKLLALLERMKKMNGSNDGDPIVNKFEVGLTNQKLGKVEVSFPGEDDVKYDTLTFGIKLDIEILVPSNASSSTTLTIKGNLNFKNIPFHLYPIEGLSDAEEIMGFDTAWMVGILDPQDRFYALQYNTHAWEIDADLTMTTIERRTSREGTVYEDEQSQGYDLVINTYPQLINLFEGNPASPVLAKKQNGIGANVLIQLLSFDFPSYAMSKATVKPEPVWQSVYINGFQNTTTDPQVANQGIELSFTNSEKDAYSIPTDYNYPVATLKNDLTFSTVVVGKTGKSVYEITFKKYVSGQGGGAIYNNGDGTFYLTGGKLNKEFDGSDSDLIKYLEETCDQDGYTFFRANAPTTLVEVWGWKPGEEGDPKLQDTLSLALNDPFLHVNVLKALASK